MLLLLHIGLPVVLIGESTKFLYFPQESAARLLVLGSALACSASLETINTIDNNLYVLVWIISLTFTNTINVLEAS